MKIKLLATLLFALLVLPVWAQLDAKGEKELNRRKQQAKKNNTALWMYDTLYKKGAPYCLLESRVQSEEGNEYMIQGLNGDDLIYIKEPSNIQKLLSKITIAANVEFSFLLEKQKLSIPKKSVSNLPNFIVKNDLVTKYNTGNMIAVKKLLFIHSSQNKQGYTSTVNTDSVGKETPKLIQKKEDTAHYQPVIRNKNFSIQINNYIIRQNGVIIGRYNKTSYSQDVVDNKTRFTIKSPDWKDIIIATNGGMGSSNWEIEIISLKKKDTFHTSSPFHKKALKELVAFLVNNNYL